MEKLDKETGKILTEGQELKELVSQPGWQVAKRKLFEQLAELDSIASLDFSQSKEDLANEIKNRESVRRIIMSWVATIDGEAQSHDYQSEILDTKKDDIIDYGD